MPVTPDIGNESFRRTEHSSGVEIGLVYGDITLERVDAIVNAANRHLQHGGGVAKAIADRGGPIIQQESNERAPVEVGKATITSAGDLPAKYVIHAVGPRYGEDDDEAKLASAVQSALSLCDIDEWRIESISLPAISTGIFSYPVDKAARTILRAIHDWLDNNNDTGLREIRICLFDRQTLNEFDAAWVEMHGG